MNITVIYASGRKTRSSTYQIAQMLIKELLEDGTCFSFFLPDDMLTSVPDAAPASLEKSMPAKVLPPWRPSSRLWNSPG